VKCPSRASFNSGILARNRNVTEFLSECATYFL
jgi:hypothetical protein